jgi:hypothetical protein
MRAIRAGPISHACMELPYGFASVRRRATATEAEHV